MQQTKIVNLGKVRDLLAEWEKVRAHIVTGHVTGWSATICDDEHETVYLGGVYQDDPAAALRAALKSSAARVLIEDPPRVKVHGT